MSEVLKVSMDLSGKLDLINRRLTEVLKTDNDRLNSMAYYAVSSGGKRLRPLIVLLVYELNTTKPIENALDLAVAYEIMHSASLIHDDIIDEAEERRGNQCLYKKYGTNDAIVAGDYLFSLAYKMGASYGMEVSNVVAKAAQKLAEGQIQESTNLGNFQISEETYFNIITNKTAYFFGAGAKTAAMIAGSSPTDQENMFNFAFNVGMAFQIADDILDIVGKEEAIGKTPFTDIKHSTLTLPMIYALKQGNERETQLLKDVLKGRKTDSESIQKAKQFLIDSGSVDYSLEKAKGFIDSAIESEKTAKISPNLQTLFEIAYSVISRIRI
ncbi:MAG: polyprenyl synthetase family protein [Cuniculiplasma sp.]